MVTVIITTYKRADFLERAINSVLNQTYKDFELIVVDDNDSNTEYRKSVEKIMKKYSNNNKIIYIQHEKNKNGAAARNTGIKLAKGEYIAFLDDDDYFFKNRLERCVNTLEKYNEYNAVYTSAIKVRNKKIYQYIHAINEGNLEFEFLKLKTCLGTGSNLFFRAEALKKINGFDEEFVRHQDLEVMVRFFEDGNLIKALNEVLVLKNEDDRINFPNIANLIASREMYLRKFKSNIQKYEKRSNQIYFECYFQLLEFCVRANDKENYKVIKNRIEKYQKISIKKNLKLFFLKVNKYIKLEKVKDAIKNIIIRKKLDKKVINEMRENTLIKY